MARLVQRARPLEVNPNQTTALRALSGLGRLHRLRPLMGHIEQKLFIGCITTPALDAHSEDYWDSVLVGHGVKHGASSTPCKPEISDVQPPFQ
jgi:hypothetical protein